MKNIHVLPTDKPSRLHLGDNGNFVFGMIRISIQSRNNAFTNQHIYTTSDEEIIEGDWYYYFGFIIKYEKDENTLTTNCKKIILTTDQDLIKDGVQAIDDEFLQWFVKNPSCEEVDVKEDECGWFVNGGKDIEYRKYNYIEIPKEESKPHSFCETPNEKCTMNYCDENGCQNRKRELVEPQQETFEEVGTYQQKLFNYLSDLGVIALQSEMQEIETIVLEMQQQDDFAIGFAEWCDETTTQVSKGEWANWLPDAKNCLSTKELLEQFKNK